MAACPSGFAKGLRFSIDVKLLWMDKLHSHHFETLVETIVGICRVSLRPSRGNLRSSCGFFFSLEHFTKTAIIPLDCLSGVKPNWAWVKIKPSGDRRFQSMFPFTRVPFWVHIFDPQPFPPTGQRAASALA